MVLCPSGVSGLDRAAAVSLELPSPRFFRMPSRVMTRSVSMATSARNRATSEVGSTPFLEPPLTGDDRYVGS